MPTDTVSLVNRSLLGIGARSTVAAMNEGSTESNAASILFQPTFEQLARAANWNCLRNQATLTLVKAAQGTRENPQGTTLPLPPSPWLYEYSYPSDCLKIRFLLPTYNSGQIGTPISSVNNLAAVNFPNVGGQIQFVVNYDTDSKGNPAPGILTNLSAAQAVYTINQPNPIVWDSMFQQAFVESLGAFLVPALNLHASLMQLKIKLAESAIAQARAIDGNEGVTTQDHIPDWIAARGTRTNYTTGYGMCGNNNYGSVNWPIG